MRLRMGLIESSKGTLVVDIAIVGAGVSGCVAARLLSSRHRVCLFEAGGYPGGHANTVSVELCGESYPVDTGFMVFNQKTYPNFCRLLQSLEVTSRASDMSFSVHCQETGLEYQGSSLDGLFAQRLNLFRPRFLGMLRDIIRFNKRGMAAAQEGDLADGRTVREFLTECRVGPMFVQKYLQPMAAAIWSCEAERILDFPAKFLIGFFANHGLMQLRNRPQWRTIVGGSRTYVRALLESLREQVFLNTPITKITRQPENVSLEISTGEVRQFDAVVMATHADDTLRLLADSTPQEQSILSAFPYQENEAVLHTDTSLMPSRHRAWASWNYRLNQGSKLPTVTYDLSRLQGLSSPTPLLLTLNDQERIDDANILRRFNYRHPAFSVASQDAQRKLEEINAKHRTYFCGAYWGYGFHEDGVNSALQVTEKFGIGIEQCIAASMREPSLTGVTAL